jgi:hypothetical protein
VCSSTSIRRSGGAANQPQLSVVPRVWRPLGGGGGVPHVRDA